MWRCGRNIYDNVDDDDDDDDDSDNDVEEEDEKDTVAKDDIVDYC